MRPCIVIPMARSKIVIGINERALAQIDRLVRDGVYPNRSKAFEAAVKDRVERIHRSRLVRECAKLDRDEEQSLAEEGYVRESEWPEC
jgi:Arc/MetJ-type ribon-helix-helix transcriptional regulator